MKKLHNELNFLGRDEDVEKFDDVGVMSDPLKDFHFGLERFQTRFPNVYSLQRDVASSAFVLGEINDGVVTATKNVGVVDVV